MSETTNKDPKHFTLHARVQEYRRKHDKAKNSFCRAGMSFTLEYVGSTTKVTFENGKKRKLGSYQPKNGMFISQMTSQNVRKRLKEGLFTAKNTDPGRWTSATIMYNPDNILRAVAKPCKAVDISGCYWQTAFNIGAIDQHTYELGLSKDREYKEARNIAIGGLGAIVTKETYVKGAKVSTERYRRFGALVRLDVIDHVFAMAQRIADKLGEDFLMFLTDCFYVPEHRFADLCSYIEAESYKWKAEDCEFGGIDRISTWVGRGGEELYSERVVWFDWKDKKRKFHNFSEKHCYGPAPSDGAIIPAPGSTDMPLLAGNANLTP